MPPETITIGLVKQVLRAQARGESAPELPPDLLQLPKGQAPIERARQIHSYLAQLILAKLADLRDKTQPAAAPKAPAPAGPPGDAPAATSTDVAAALAADFACANSNLEAWSALYHRYLSDADMPVEALAAAAHVSERQFRRRVETGIQLLTEQLRLAAQAAQGRQRLLRLDRHLPPADYLQLFGVQEQIAAAVGLLTDKAGPAIVAFEGMGGIGKTTLAQAIAQRLAVHGPFAAVLWVSAQQQRLLPGTGAIEALPEPALTFAELSLQLIRQLGRDDLLSQGPDEWEKALQALFHTTPYLIVVDNLETMADHRALTPRLRRMLGPSRALITSRQSLSEYAFVQARPVPPLSLADSLTLVRSELTRAGRHVQTPHNGELVEVCALVGGLPLALKLIAGLLNRGVPLGRIRDDLRSAAGEAQILYNYIYRQTWRLLHETARQLLVELLLISSNGEDLPWIEMTSRLPAAELRADLAHLLSHCLVQITGSLEHPFYRLHPLTVIFLKTDLVGHFAWEEGEVTA